MARIDGLREEIGSAVNPYSNNKYPGYGSFAGGCTSCSLGETGEIKPGPSVTLFLLTGLSLVILYKLIKE